MRAEVTFVGSGPYLRLPEVLQGAGTRVTVVADRRNCLRGSQFVDRFVEVEHAATEDIAEGLLARPDIVAGLHGWVIPAQDATLRRLADSDLPVSTKLRILPVRRAEGLSLLGSKAGLVRLLDAVGGDGPRSAVAAEPGDLGAAAAAVGRDGPLLVKADLGSSGYQVRQWRAGEDAAVPQSWFPVVVQEFVEGPEADVDALFHEGRLLGWTYSRVVAAVPGFGPSTVRCYLPAPTQDFARTLARLGAAAGLHGFVNCSFIWSPAQRRHYVFEVDVRPSAWAQFGPRLGVDWARLMAAPETVDEPVRPGLAGGEHRQVRLYPRALIDGLDRRDWSGVRPWLYGLRGTWSERNARDRGVNAADRRDVRAALVNNLRIGAAQVLVAARRTLANGELSGTPGRASPRQLTGRRGR